MRFLHTGDLHIGKKLHGYDLLADQKQVLAEILEIAKAEKADALVIAGDLYDRSVPAVEAIELFNQFIIEANLQMNLPILAVSGNHDSGVRLEAGAPWYSQTQFYLHTRLQQAFQPVEIGGVQFFLLPYFEPIAARLYFEDEEIRTLAQAMARVVPALEAHFDPAQKQVLIAHFFVAGSERSDSETKVEVGGLDSVPSSLLKNFDYVALGHLHSNKALQQERMRYSGSPLKFSLSELQQQKGLWLVELPEFQLTFKALQPLHEMRMIEGRFEELLQAEFYEQVDREAYLEIRLTDRAVIPNMMSQLRQVYPRILSVERINGRQTAAAKVKPLNLQQQSPQQLITSFFEEMAEHPLNDRQTSWVAEILAELQKSEGGEQ